MRTRISLLTPMVVLGCVVVDAAVQAFTVDEIPTLIAVNASKGDEALPSRVGVVVEAGYRHSFGSNVTIDAAGRLTTLGYERGRALLSANSVGLLLGASYHFDR